MRPLDPRLIARIGPARRYVLVTAVLGVATALLILAQALLIARVLAPVLAPAPLTEDGLRAQLIQITTAAAHRRIAKMFVI